MKQKGFIFPSLYIYAGLGLIVLTLGIAVKVQTARLAAKTAEYDSFVSTVAEIGRQAEIDKNKEIERQKKVTKDVSSDYENRLNLLRDTYARLRDQRSGSGSMPPIPNAPRSIDEISTDSIPLAGICAETTQQLNSLQNWIKAQSSNLATSSAVSR